MASIRKELKQSRPYESPGQEAVVSLLRTAGLVRRRFEALCEEHGVTFQQFNVLRILRGAERSGEGALPTMEVAARMIEPEPGITRMMGRLEAKGLVRRERSSEDGRRLLCHITKKGLRSLARLDDPILQLDDAALGQLTEKELRTLTRLLDRSREPTGSPS